MHGGWPLTLWQAALFCLVMKLHLLCVYKSLKPQMCTLSTTPVRSCIFRGQVPRNLSFYLTLLLLSRFTWLVLRVLIPFPIVLSRCSPTRSLLRYSSLLRYPPLMPMLALLLLSVSMDSYHETTFSALPLTLPVAM